MAYTLPVLRCDGQLGKVACYLVDPADRGNTEPLTDPLAHIGRVIWHSDLEYLEVFSDETVTLTFPARDTHQAPFDGIFAYHDWYPFSPAGFSTEPYGIIQVNGVLIPHALVLKETAPGLTVPQRLITIRVETAGIVIRELWRAAANIGHPLEQQSITVRGILFGARAPSGTKLIDMDAGSGVMKLGRSVIDTSNTKGFLRQSATPTGLAVTAERTIDSVPGGMRVWRTDGTYADTSAYNGTYAGPTIRQVTV